MFHKDKCDLCGDCLVECKSNEYNREVAIAQSVTWHLGETMSYAVY